MNPKQHLAALRAALKTLDEAEKQVELVQSKITTAENRKTEIEVLEEPTKKQLDELVRLDRELPFLTRPLERAEAEINAARRNLAEAVESAWPFVVAQINAQEAVELDRAAEAVTPWCLTRAQAIGCAERLPRIRELNYLARELEAKFDAGNVNEVALKAVELLAVAAPETQAETV